MEQIRTLTSEAIDIALSNAPARERRLQIGAVLSRMFRADAFISYVCDPSGPYADPVQINLGDDMIAAYNRHFRHVDALTPEYFKMRRASLITTTNESHDEFVHDFLHRADQHHGMNYFPALPVPGSIDLRLWRGSRRVPFTVDDVRLLQSFGDLLSRLWPLETPSSLTSLTAREAQIAKLVAHGLSDKEISADLGISLPTLRTHLSHAFTKAGVANRAGLATYFLLHHQK